MAKPLEQLQPIYHIPFIPQRVIMKKCGNPNCKEIISSHDGFEYLHSKATDEFYCDMVCMARAEETEIDFLDDARRDWFMNEMEAELCG